MSQKSGQCDYIRCYNPLLDENVLCFTLRAAYFGEFYRILMKPANKQECDKVSKVFE